MKISTRGRYGLYFMMSLAENYGFRKKSVRAIAEERDISDLYLEQIVAVLRKENLVKSTRGAHGGYELIKPPGEIYVGQILHCLENNILAVESDQKDRPPEKYLWSRLRDALKDVIDHTTLEDLLKHDIQVNDEYMFYI